MREGGETERWKFEAFESLELQVSDPIYNSFASLAENNCLQLKDANTLKVASDSTGKPILKCQKNLKLWKFVNSKGIFKEKLNFARIENAFCGLLCSLLVQ